MGYLGSPTGWAHERFDRPTVHRLQAEIVRSAVEALIEDDGISIVLQPVVSLTTGEHVGYEAVARFETGDVAGDLFAVARSAGIGVDLELAALRAALHRLPDLPAGTYLTMNVSSSAIVDRRVVAEVTAAAGDVVVALTEQGTVPCRPVSAALERHGIRLELDDVGAGSASLLRILRLEPSMVKLDRELVSALATCERARALVESVLHVAAHDGAAVIAEGVATRDDERLLGALGVPAAQGPRYGQPCPAPWETSELLSLIS